MGVSIKQRLPSVPLTLEDACIFDRLNSVPIGFTYMQQKQGRCTFFDDRLDADHMLSWQLDPATQEEINPRTRVAYRGERQRGFMELSG